MPPEFIEFVLVVFAVVVGAAIAVASLRAVQRRSLLQQRLYLQQAPGEETAPGQPRERRGFLRRWLALAGYRSPSAPLSFILATAAAIGLGGATLAAFYWLGVDRVIVDRVAGTPGGVGDIFLPIAIIAPWIVFIILAGLPLMIVRRSRRQRVQLVEQDLPLAMELFATLSEAGLGFDAALARVLQTRLGSRPLAAEFRRFQADLLSGRPRIECLRRLAARLNVPAVTVLTSALVQAEQIGMGVARVLRTQADDLRIRRREKANAYAMSLPVKRLFPLVICFLPGIFVWTLGPFFVQLFQLADTFLQVREF